MKEVKSCKTPLEDLRNSALAEYELASSAIHSWNSFIVNAIKNYDPARTEQIPEHNSKEMINYLLVNALRNLDDEKRQTLIRALAEKTSKLPEQSWIDVNDRLPEDYQKVIIKTEYGEQFAIYHEDVKRFRNPSSTLDGVHLIVGYWADVIAWQPLPK